MSLQQRAGLRFQIWPIDNGNYMKLLHVLKQQAISDLIRLVGRMGLYLFTATRLSLSPSNSGRRCLK